MFTKSKKASVVTVALALAFAILLALFMPIVHSPAFADENPDLPDSDTPVYYISDYAGSYELKNRLIENSVVEKINLYCYSNPSSTATNYYKNWYEFLDQLEADGVYDNFQNTYIIFEVRTKFESCVVSPSDGIFTDWLLQHFSAWKEDGCHILFISGTDEVWFYNDIYERSTNEFLTHVDVHINTDLLTPFVENALFRLSDINDYTFILNKFFLDDINPLNSWFYTNYFAPLLKAHGADLDERYADVANNLLKEKMLDTDALDIKILTHCGNNDYYDCLQSSNYTYDNPSDFKRDYGDQLGIIGGAYEKINGYTLNWYNAINKLIGESHILGVPIFFYNTQFKSASEYPFTYRQTDLLHIANDPDWEELANDTFYNIVKDFLTSDLNNHNDLKYLSRYHNWPTGKCRITHKLMTFGPNGWMTDGYCNRQNTPKSYIQKDDVIEDEAEFEARGNQL